MALEQGFAIGLDPVSGAVRARRFVVVGSNGQVSEVATSGGTANAVTLEPSLNGDTNRISCGAINGGKLDIEAGAAIPAGTRIMSDAQGRAITATGAAARVQGITLQAATAAGEIIEFLADREAGQFVA